MILSGSVMSGRASGVSSRLNADGRLGVPLVIGKRLFFMGLPSVCGSHSPNFQLVLKTWAGQNDSSGASTSNTFIPRRVIISQASLNTCPVPSEVCT